MSCRLRSIAPLLSLSVLMSLGACGSGDVLPTASSDPFESHDTGLLLREFVGKPALARITVNGEQVDASMTSYTNAFGVASEGEVALGAGVARLEASLAALAARRFTGDQVVETPGGGRVTLHVDATGLARSVTVLRAGTTQTLTLAWPSRAGAAVGVDFRADGALGRLSTSVECRSVDKASRESFVQSDLGDDPCGTARKWLASAILAYESAVFAVFLEPFNPAAYLFLGAAEYALDAARSNVTDVCGECFTYVAGNGDIVRSCEGGGGSGTAE